MRNRTAAVILAVAALLGTSTAVASASPSELIYATLYQGPYADQATCTALQVAANDPPDELTTGCFFSQTNPGRGGGHGPGWYYRAMILIS